MRSSIAEHHLKTRIKKYLHIGMNGRVSFPDNRNLLLNIFPKTHTSHSFFYTIPTKQKPRALRQETKYSVVPLYLPKKSQKVFSDL
mgnify:CR=1 FL=1